MSDRTADPSNDPTADLPDHVWLFETPDGPARFVLESDYGEVCKVRDSWCEAFTRARDALLLERQRLISRANHLGKKGHEVDEYVDRVEAIDKALA